MTSFLLWLLPGLQDPAALQDLLRRLEDDRLEAREQAQEALVALGEPVIPVLETALLSASPETRARLEDTLARIRISVEVRGVYREGPLIRLKGEARPLTAVLADLERQSGVKMDASAVDPEAPVGVEAEDEPLLKVLDRLCEGCLDRSFELPEGGGVRFLKEMHPSGPAAYVGPFRIRAAQVYGLRGTDFKGVVTNASLTLTADWERSLKPSPSPVWSITGASDDRRNPLTPAQGSPTMQIIPGLGNGRIRLMPMGGILNLRGSAATTVVLSGFDAGARRFAVSGQAGFSFPIAPKLVSFKEPGEEALTQEQGDTILTMRRIGNGPIWQLTLSPARGSPPGWADALASRMPAEGVTAVDDEGTETTVRLVAVNASVRRFNAEGVDSAPSVTYQIQLTRAGRPLKEFRFTFVTQVFLKTVSFELRDIPLP
jgi:hypothetical protein